MTGSWYKDIGFSLSHTIANTSQERTKNAQFIIISLRNNMFELADRLVGIFKTDNCTKSVTINPSLLSMAVPLTAES